MCKWFSISKTTNSKTAFQNLNQWKILKRIKKYKSRQTGCKSVHNVGEGKSKIVFVRPALKNKENNV